MDWPSDHEQDWNPSSRPRSSVLCPPVISREWGRSAFGLEPSKLTPQSGTGRPASRYSCAPNLGLLNRLSLPARCSLPGGYTEIDTAGIGIHRCRSGSDVMPTSSSGSQSLCLQMHVHGSLHRLSTAGGHADAEDSTPTYYGRLPVGRTISVEPHRINSRVLFSCRNDQGSIRSKAGQARVYRRTASGLHRALNRKACQYKVMGCATGKD